ncbi:hypothetical protein [Ekhidna sp.]|uniref:hypothetical protein n=1 Tax=Ekhidna sp. TaxID=2608089 RepID=UPI003C7E5F86
MDVREFKSERRKQRFRFWNFLFGTVVLGLIGYFIQWKQVKIEEEISNRQLQIDYFNTFLPHYMDVSKSGIDRQIMLLEYMEIMSEKDLKAKYRQLLDSALSKRQLYNRLDSLSKASSSIESLLNKSKNELSLSSSENEALKKRINELEVKTRKIEREKNDIKNRLSISTPLVAPYGISKYWVNRNDSIIIRISINDTVFFNESLRLILTKGNKSEIAIETNYSGSFDFLKDGSAMIFKGLIKRSKESVVAQVPTGKWYVKYEYSTPRKITFNDEDIWIDEGSLAFGDYYYLKIQRE